MSTPLRGSFHSHQEVIELCKKPKKRNVPTLHKCVQCGKRITSRNWRSRKPENRLPYCEHHIRQIICTTREAWRQ